MEDNTKVFQVVVDFGQQVETKEALIVASDRDAALEAVAAKVSEGFPEGVPGHSIECEELTPDYIATLYRSSVDHDSPFRGSVDWTGFPDRVLDVLLPQTDLKDFVKARADIEQMRAGGEAPTHVEIVKPVGLG